MTSSALTTYVVFLYLACWFGYLLVCTATPPQSAARRAMLGMLVIVWGLSTAAIGLRWIESYQMGIGRAPLSNLYESLIFFSWSIALALIIVRLRYRVDSVILIGLPLVLVTMGYTFFLDREIKPLIPALQSNWLVIHVVTCFLGYAGFTVSFIAALLYLVVKAFDAHGKYLPTPELLDEITYRAVLVGYPLLTVGIITGAAWADYAWGSYWSWDPKETWSLITWMVYSAFLHARLARDWKGHRTAVLSLVGFAAVLFTYFGVNYLPGLHSYF
ncbi:MAG: c-type cytochrome biogenesis protein CcsB [Desulfomonilaceae bacterium]|nr:c-type cytochrome biogenesis protein CcsB [Desulfomonilaceae bacterium]